MQMSPSSQSSVTGPVQAPFAWHWLAAVQTSWSSHAFPTPLGMHADGSPLHAKHSSTEQTSLQPSPEARFPSSHSSGKLTAPSPQRAPLKTVSRLKGSQNVAGEPG